MEEPISPIRARALTGGILSVSAGTDSLNSSQFFATTAVASKSNPFFIDKKVLLEEFRPIFHLHKHLSELLSPTSMQMRIKFNTTEL
jgi:hypothetical protein